MNRWMYVVPALGFLVIAAFLFVGLNRARERPPNVLPSVLIDKPAPPIALGPMDALTPGFSRADLASGHVTVVNFFASWCVPCREEAEILNQLAKIPGMTLYGVDYEDQRQNKDGQDGRNFLTQVGNPFSRIVADVHGSVGIDWGVDGVPETFVVDGKGIIRFKVVGPLDGNIVRSQLLPEIEKAKKAT